MYPSELGSFFTDTEVGVELPIRDPTVSRNSEDDGSVYVEFTFAPNSHPGSHHHSHHVDAIIESFSTGFIPLNGDLEVVEVTFFYAHKARASKASTKKDKIIVTSMTFTPTYNPKKNDNQQQPDDESGYHRFTMKYVWKSSPESNHQNIEQGFLVVLVVGIVGTLGMGFFVCWSYVSEEDGSEYYTYYPYSVDGGDEGKGRQQPSSSKPKKRGGGGTSNNSASLNNLRNNGRNNAIFEIGGRKYD
jgi:hypothetical protein